MWYAVGSIPTVYLQRVAKMKCPVCEGELREIGYTHIGCLCQCKKCGMLWEVIPTEGG